MLIGVLLGIAAGALWGLIYIAPLLVPQYNPVLVALGRFISFGIVSLPCLWFLRHELKKFTRADIWEAFKLPFFGNVIFYSMLTICIRMAGAPLAGMFMAVIPVLVAIVSNVRYAKEGRAIPWSRILPPLAVIFAGLVIANWSEFKMIAEASAGGGQTFWIGVGFGIAAVFAWTWFSIYNADWLLEHPHHSTSAWTALQGVTVLPVVLGAFALLAWPIGFMDTSVHFMGPEPVTFLLVALMVGLLCSWVAMLAWNQMSQRLPAAHRLRIGLRRRLRAHLPRGTPDRHDGRGLHHPDGGRAGVAPRLPSAARRKAREDQHQARRPLRREEDGGGRRPSARLTDDTPHQSKRPRPATGCGLFLERSSRDPEPVRTGSAPIWM